MERTPARTVVEFQHLDADGCLVLQPDVHDVGHLSGHYGFVVPDSMMLYQVKRALGKQEFGTEHPLYALEKQPEKLRVMFEAYKEFWKAFQDDFLYEFCFAAVEDTGYPSHKHFHDGHPDNYIQNSEHYWALVKESFAGEKRLFSELQRFPELDIKDADSVPEMECFRCGKQCTCEEKADPKGPH